MKVEEDEEREEQVKASKERREAWPAVFLLLERGETLHCGSPTDMIREQSRLPL